MVNTVLNNIRVYCTNEAEENLEHVTGGWGNHSVFPHADILGVSTEHSLVISIVVDSIIHLEEDFLKH